MIKEEYDLIIIGAGFCGLIIGQSLTQSSFNFKIFEKSKAFGGRASTRRISGQSVDHGLQYFTPQNREFATWMQAYLEQGLIKLWANQFYEWKSNNKKLSLEEKSNSYYACPNGMTSLMKEIAKVLPVSREIKIMSAERDFEENIWTLETDQQIEIKTKKIICTAPLEQSLNLFKNYLSSAEELALSKIEYNSALIGIFAFEFDEMPCPDWKGIICSEHEILNWIAQDSSKRDKPNQLILVAQCNPEFSQKNFNESEEILLAQIEKALKSILPNFNYKLKEKQLKKWLYAEPISGLNKPFMSAIEDSLILCGDWCLASRLEGSFLSGKAVSEHLLNI